MKRFLQAFVAAVLFGSITIHAEPFKTWSWTGPDTYENGNPIIGDQLTFRLHCGTDLGGPYPETILLDLQTPPALQDMVSLVMGTPGTYYCVETASSFLYSSTSGFSNEVDFIVAPSSLGFVPLPPILSVQ